jgi:UDP-N-acetylmuramate: L-alanyl-gamma-D-glutamyl-meso-diaminopimelate ligase
MAGIGTLRRVHFIAVGGTGMGSLAGLLAARGIEVTGSDKALYPPMSTALARWGIPVVEGFDPANLEGTAFGSELQPDLVVIGNAVRRENPEARAAIDSGLPYRSFSDALYELAMADKHRVVVSGTHGKTTTTSMIAALLLATGRDPSLLVGGISLDFGGSFREGVGEHFVVEGDEYDTAFFDKTPKFLHYHPQTLVITSVEFDHADIYRDLEHVKSAFRELVLGMPDDGIIVADWSYQNVRDVVEGAPCRVLRYGVHGTDAEAADAEDAPRPLADTRDWSACDLRVAEEGTRFELARPGGAPSEALLPMHGDFNVANAVAALAVLDSLGVPAAEGIEALRGFRGVKRRQEIRGEAAGVSVVDDFAHHPTAVRGSVAALRGRYVDRRLVAIFEPRTNTSRRAVFQEQYGEAFGGADHVIVRRVPDEPIYSATGEASELFSADELVATLQARGISAEAFDEVDDIVADRARESRAGDVILVMSNGDFGNIWEKLLAELAERR